jgi:hypothetical protein
VRQTSRRRFRGSRPVSYTLFRRLRHAAEVNIVIAKLCKVEVASRDRTVVDNT